MFVPASSRGPNLAGTINTRIIKFQEVRLAMFDGLEALCLRNILEKYERCNGNIACISSIERPER